MSFFEVSQRIEGIPLIDNSFEILWYILKNPELEI
jgi:hypothetical protein